MTGTHNLLVELFVEELPPKALKKLGEAFSALLLQGLRAQGLATDQSAVNGFASPRRLAARVSHVLPRAEPKAERVRLMPKSVGWTANNVPTPALLKKLEALAAMGVMQGATERGVYAEPDGKAEALFLDSVRPGATLAAGLQAALDEAIHKLPIPKVMQYQLADGWTSVNFVRPARGLVALHGADVVPVSALGLSSGRQTRGHRFEAAVDPVVLQHADHYEHQLAEQGAVIADFAARRGEVVRQLAAVAAREGLKPIDDEALLDEVTALVERPNVLLCRFERDFLAVPPECLILTMKANQKYFPLLDAAGGLTEKFLVVSNIRPADASRVIEGNERVVRPRLADAKFFFDQDRKRTLESRVPALAKVVYHGKLGSQGERVERVRKLTRWVAERIGADVDLAERAALLAKADLLTDMVGEFPELQGVMGGYYARHDGEDPRVADAIASQYAVHADDQSPQGVNLIAQSLLIADRTETIVGIWSVGLKPTGDKDPFAIRRHALGIIGAFEIESVSSALGGREAFDLPALLQAAASTFPVGLVLPEFLDEIREFILERYSNKVAFLFSPQQRAAVLALDAPITSFVARLQAVKAFADLPEAAALAAANKRVGNILKKSDAVPGAPVDTARLVEPAEAALADALANTAPRADAAFEKGDYAASLQTLAALKAPVDAFFEAVMVNADDPALRANRLALLGRLHAAMNRVADLSKLAS